MVAFQRLAAVVFVFATAASSALVAPPSAAATATASKVDGLARQHFLIVPTAVSTSESLDALHVLAELAARYVRSVVWSTLT